MGGGKRGCKDGPPASRSLSAPGRPAVDEEASASLSGSAASPPAAMDLATLLQWLEAMEARRCEEEEAMEARCRKEDAQHLASFLQRVVQPLP